MSEDGPNWGDDLPQFCGTRCTRTENGFARTIHRNLVDADEGAVAKMAEKLFNVAPGGLGAFLNLQVADNGFSQGSFGRFDRCRAMNGFAEKFGLPFCPVLLS